MEEQTPKKKKNSTWNLINKQWASTIIFSGIVLMLVAFLFIRHTIFTNVLTYVWDIIRPIVIGLVISFLLYRPTDLLQNIFEKLKEWRKWKRFPSNALAVILAYVLMIAIIVSVISIIVPQFIDSITDFAGNLMSYYNKLIIYVNSEKGTRIKQLLTTAGIDITQWRSLLNNFSDFIPTAVGTVGTWASGLIGTLIDFFIGLIFSIYVTAGRKKLSIQSKRLFQHFIPEKHYNRLTHYTGMIFNTFSEFISGKILASFIVGILTFLCMIIGGLEYPMMIAVFVGITNIVPVVGPFVGAIPCALILLLVNPWHMVAFVIIILIIQQIDSNLLTPYIVGNSIGLPALWVLFAITIGGGMFGIIGMLLGVPVMSVLYNVVKEKTSTEEERIHQKEEEIRQKEKRKKQAKQVQDFFKRIWLRLIRKIKKQ